MLKMAVPSQAPGGLDAEISQHFGHCDVFTLVDVESREVKNVETMTNDEHAQGGCMAPVMTLKNAGVDILSAGGMGMRPLSGFQQVGIDVYLNRGAKTVADAIDLILSGEAPRFGPAHVCGGHDKGSCGSH